MMNRRTFCASAASAAAGLCFGLRAGVARADDFADTLQRDLAAIEGASGGRLGVAVLDTRTGARAAHRANERFPMCSTFKFLAAAAVLKRVDKGQERLDRKIAFDA